MSLNHADIWNVAVIDNALGNIGNGHMSADNQASQFFLVFRDMVHDEAVTSNSSRETGYNQQR